MCVLRGVHAHFPLVCDSIALEWIVGLLLFFLCPLLLIGELAHLVSNVSLDICAHVGSM